MTGLQQIYCDLRVQLGGAEMSLQSLQKDRVTFVKKDGTVIRSDIPAVVGPGQITTFVIDLPIEIEDHFLRQLPNGMVEDYVASEPSYMSGISGANPPHYQIKVHRSGAPVAPPQTNYRELPWTEFADEREFVDNSVNIAADISNEQLSGFLAQVSANLGVLPAEQQKAITTLLAELEAGTTSSKPSQSKIRSVLQMIKTITEGAAGNLVASGITAAIVQILGSG
ncbi:MAG: hypothetical protein WBQ55_29190 [Xanthobacteraceae bacterium]